MLPSLTKREKNERKNEQLHSLDSIQNKNNRHLVSLQTAFELFIALVKWIYETEF